LTVLTARVANPTGYGRIVRGRDGKVAKIVEQRDATVDEQAITEINTGIMIVRHNMLGPALRLVGRQNSQNEYYLTDLVDVLYRGGHVTAACEVADASEAAGVNDREQLANAESVMRQRINARWLRAGVTLWDPHTTYIDSDVQLEADVTLWPGTVLRGRTTLSTGAEVGPNAVVDDSAIGPRSRVESATVLGTIVGADCHVGSYVRLDVGTTLPDGTRVLA
jgi:bifunctional UDP-N-acetylglucosamine pyrophosphorylase/glucosamine-1-phosphate N-acetyltransferase